MSDSDSVSSISSDANFDNATIDGLEANKLAPDFQRILHSNSTARKAARESIRQLALHGCENVTDHIDTDSFDSIPLFQGAFGDVYSGNLFGGLRVAIKTPQISLNILEENPDYAKDVAREIHTWSKCDHANVLHFLGLVEFRGRIGMVSPWMENGRLPHYTRNVMSVDLCKLCAQISEGVAYLHNVGIVHGDLKGDNILVSGSGEPVVCDFGGSLLKNRSLKVIPSEKGLCFTSRWAAPELLDSEDEGCNTKESDIYALGMTILVSRARVSVVSEIGKTAAALGNYDRKTPMGLDTSGLDDL
ncbi:protein kinase, partial [Rhizoctonia solani]